MVRFITILAILSTVIVCNGQNQPSDFRLWGLSDIAGEASIRGHYRWKESNLARFGDASENLFFTGGLKLLMDSYVLHPDFLFLDLRGEYNPGTNVEDYIVTPDRSEVITNKSISLNATLLKSKPITLSTFGNLNHSYYNREYITSVKSYSRSYGSTFFWRNKVLPVHFRYQVRKWDQNELETRRLTRTDQKNFYAKASKSFSSYDKHELDYSHSNLYRENDDSGKTLNLINEINLANTFFFDKNKRYSYRSVISSLDRQNQYHFNRFQVMEDLIFRFSNKFSLSAGYNYFDVQQNEQNYKQHQMDGAFVHRLYESLTTSVNSSYNTRAHTVYEEENKRIGVSFKYTKKIPVGLLRLGYSAARLQRDMNSLSPFVDIFNEEHVLADDQIVLLNNPHVDYISIVVKDETGAIIYDRFFDYTVFIRGSFIEIKRTLGGQIADGAIVLIDYSAKQVGSYQFTSANRTFSGGVLLFNQLVDLYFRTSKLYYPSEDNTTLLVLNRFVQYVYGIRFGRSIIRGGVEYDSYQSNIIPYNKYRCFVQLNGRFGNKATASLNGDYNHYYFTQTDIVQTFASVSGNINYQPVNRLRLSLDLGVRRQRGIRSLDLDLIYGKGEMNYMVKKIQAAVGAEYFKRDYFTNDLNFRGIYFNIRRLF